MTKAMIDLLDKYGIKEKDTFEAELNKALAETHIPKTVFNETNEKLKQAVKESNDKDALIEQGRKDRTSFDDMSKKYEELVNQQKAERERFDKELLNTRRGYALDNALTKAGARNNKSVKALLDESRITLSDDGTLIGFDEQLKSLKKDNGFLFNDPEPAKETKPSWGNGNQQGNTAGADGMATAIAKAMGI